MRTNRLNGAGMDAYSKKLIGLRLVPSGLNLESDGSWADKLDKATRYLVVLEEERLARGGEPSSSGDALSKFLESLGIDASTLLGQLCFLLMLLPRGHHLTPAERIDTVGAELYRLASSYGYHDAGFRLDGPAPPGGRFEALAKCGQLALKSKEEDVQLGRVLRACGFTFVDDVVAFGQEKFVSRYCDGCGTTINSAHHKDVCETRVGI